MQAAKIATMTPRMALSAITLAALCTSGAYAADAPLYNEFQRICVATGDQPDAVARAAEAAGARQVRTFADNAPPHPTGVTILDRQQGATHLSITTGTEAHPPAPAEPQTIFTHNCAVTAEINDEASVTALRTWARVSPQRVLHTGATIFIYTWEQIGSQHVVLPDAKESLHDAVAGGRVWNLIVVQAPHYLSAELMNRLPN